MSKGHDGVGNHNSRKNVNLRYRFCHWLLYAVVLSGFCLVIWKAIGLQILEHATWAERSRAQTQSSLKVPGYRGSIYDTRGRLLSYSVPQPSLYADAKRVADPVSLAKRLSKMLHEPEGSLTEKLASQRRFVWLKRHMTDKDALWVRALGVEGLGLMNEYKRFYPYGQLGGQVLGFVGLDGEGLEGLEKGYDEFLRKDHRVFSHLRDGGRRILWHGHEPPPEPAESVGLQLTLDAFLQYIAEHELEKAALKYNASAGQVVVLDPQTFEILAIANWPFFDPNLPGKAGASRWRNRAITDAFEPGSTFKVFLMGAALEEKVVTVADRIFCENGRARIAGHNIKDTHPYGWLTMSEVIKYSSNIASSKIALELGRERYGRYIRSFGFGALTNVELPGEIRGLLRPEESWRPIDLATTGFGQSIGVTALQLTVGAACIANGGVFAEPVLVRHYLDPDGNVTQSFQSGNLRRVLSENTAQQLTRMMVMATERGGTGINAVPKGYVVAGKTGTAQMIDPETGRYAKSRYTSSFTGFVPADNPGLVITVVIHEPKGAIYGGTVAAPVFREIAGRALPYLGVMPFHHEQMSVERLQSVKTEGVIHATETARDTSDVLKGDTSVARALDAGSERREKKAAALDQDVLGRTRISRPMPGALYRR